jgi:predicted  nucleic acid-binding Zn-ribbon protein
MGRRMVSLCVTALLVLPVAGALAVPAIQSPPGLSNAKAKLNVAITNQIAKENARFDMRSAPVLEQIAPLTDLQEQAADLEAQIGDLQDEIDASLDPLAVDVLEEQQAALEADLTTVQDQIAALEEQFAPLLDKLQALNDQHDRKLQKLQDKLAGKMAKFDAKIAAWQEKHGIVPEP